MSTINAQKLECHLDQNVLAYYQDGFPYTGTVYEMLGNQIDLAYQVVDGLKHGFELELYPNRRIQSIKHYVNNLLDGPLTRLYESGELEETALFERGVCVKSIYHDNNNHSKPIQYTISPESAEYAWLTYMQQEFAHSYA